MATNTPNLNLVKPEMSDYADIRVLNKNMDIIDTAINEIMTGAPGSPGSPGLQYLKDVTATDTDLTFTKNDGSSINVPLNRLPVPGGDTTGDLTGSPYLKDVTKTDTGLTFTKNDGNSINVQLDYLPLTGGNVTGSLTVNEKTLVYVLDKLVDDANEKYKITAIKYSDGTLKQIVNSKIQNDSAYTNVTFLVPFTNVDDITVNAGTKLPESDEYKDPYFGWFRAVANLSTTGVRCHFNNQHMYWDYTFIGYWK